MGDYSSLYKRIQEEIDVEDMTQENVEEFIRAGSNRGKLKLAKEITTSFAFARSNKLIQKFVKSKNIELSEKIKANTEKWSGQERIVIRNKGRFVSWKILKN